MKDDRRVRYTKMALRDSLISLMQQRPIERITVKEICEGADINRSTFYVHYGSPRELLDSMKAEMYDEMRAMPYDYGDMQTLTLRLCELFKAHSDLLSVLAKSMECVGFVYDLVSMRKEDLLRACAKLGVPPERAEIAFSYVAAGGASVVVNWALGGYAVSASDVARDITRLTVGCIDGFLKEEHKNA